MFLALKSIRLIFFSETATLPRRFRSSRIWPLTFDIRVASSAPRPVTFSMFSILSPAQDLSICLRCQYRLSIRQGPRPGRQRHKRFSQQRRCFAVGTSQRQEASTAHDAATDDGIVGKPLVRYLAEEASPYQQHRHESGPPTKGTLGLNVLGEPAEVLILREKQKRFELDKAMAMIRASGPDKNPSPESISSSQMLEMFAAERGIIDIDDACKNIESLRTSLAAAKKGPINEDVYKDLALKLHQGFTKRQLQAYWDRTTSDLPDERFDLDVDFANTVYARSSWQLVENTTRSENTPLADRQPRTPMIIMSSDAELAEDLTLKKRNFGVVLKESLVRRILRRCWKIKPSVPESSRGEVDLRLTPLHLKLISKHSKRPRLSAKTLQR